MTFDPHARIELNTLLVVRYGRDGEQLAKFDGRTRRGWLNVYKWRRNSGTWTGRVIVEPGEVLRLATREDERKFLRA